MYRIQVHRICGNWKKNEKLGDAITLKGGDILTLKKGESWNLFLEKGILNFYMPKKCTVSLYNNSGTSVFSNGILQAYETKNVITSGYAII